jgi:hypothetical protein
MKKTLIIALLALPILSYSQTEMGKFAQVNSKKDTLFLLENDPLTKLTFKIWKSDSTWNGQNPTIVFVNTKAMEEIKFAYFRQSNEFVRMRKTPIKTKNK